MSLIKNGKKIAGLYKATEVEHASEEHAGLIEIASQAEMLEGVIDSKAVTPKKFKDNLADVALSGEYSELLGKPENLSDFNDDLGIGTHISNDNIHVSSDEKLSWNSKQDKLVAGTNITIDPNTNTISASGGLAEVSWGGITGTLGNQADLKIALDSKAYKSELPTKLSELTDDLGLATKTELEDGLATKQPIGDYATNSSLNAHTGNGTIHVTASDKIAWSQKQPYIEDLDTIRDGASKGATALQEYNETDPTVPAHVKSITSNDITNWNNKQEVISDINAIRVNANAGKTASDTISGYGDIVTHNANEFQAAGDYATNTDLTEGLANKQDTLIQGENIKIEQNVISAVIPSATLPDETTINLNDDNELQAIGLIDKNSESPIYDWVGTKQEHEDQSIATEHPDWICFITDDFIVSDTVDGGSGSGSISSEDIESLRQEFKEQLDQESFNIRDDLNQQIIDAVYTGKSEVMSEIHPEIQGIVNESISSELDSISSELDSIHNNILALESSTTDELTSIQQDLATATDEIHNIQNNLVTSLDETCTDEQYPSAKCIYDILNELKEALEEI